MEKKSPDFTFFAQKLKINKEVCLAVLQWNLLVEAILSSDIILKDACQALRFVFFLKDGWIKREEVIKWFI